MQNVGLLEADLNRGSLSIGIDNKGPVRLDRSQVVVINRDILEHRPVSDHLKVTGKISVLGQKVSDLVRIPFKPVQD